MRGVGRKVVLQWRVVKRKSAIDQWFVVVRRGVMPRKKSRLSVNAAAEIGLTIASDHTLYELKSCGCILLNTNRIPQLTRLSMTKTGKCVISNKPIKSSACFPPLTIKVVEANSAEPPTPMIPQQIPTSS